MVIDLNRVRSVYMGKAGHCMCGCSGKHYYASAYRKIGAEIRGYEVYDNEVSDRIVKDVVDRINTARRCAVKDLGNCFSLTHRNKVYVAYLIPAGVEAPVGDPVNAPNL